MIIISPALRSRLRTPLKVLAVLLALQFLNMILGAFVPNYVWYVEALISVAMIVIIMIYPMHLIEAPPLLWLFAGFGFFWTAIMFALVMIDYATR